jgi:serine/threonine protein kinase/tetratricopeptide (TPR) repeat protein
MNDLVGKIILHYKIIEQIGQGGMGVVYLAEDTKLERKVALKLLPHYISTNEEERERFKIEAKAAAALNHPNIATIHAIEESGDDTFTVMEYIDGVELKDKIKSGPIPVKEAINIVIQIAEGLEAAHKKGIVHRDIKSQNIMMTKDDKVKIMDFGLAKIGKGSQITKTGTTLGTLAYMSPEQIRGVRTDSRSDIFSFGVVTYEMFTGHLPFEAEHEAAILHLIMNDQPKQIENYRSDVPEDLLYIINHLIEKNPDDRYQSVSDILIDLHSLKQKTSKETQPFRGTRQSKPAKKKKLILGLTTFIILALMVISYFFFFTKNAINYSSTTKTESLAVMYFENIPDQEDKKHIGDMITNLLITNLSQSKEMEVISREQLYRILEDIGLSDNKIITRKTAIKVAQNAGVSTILVGSILQEDPSLAVTTRLIDVNSGNILGSQRLVGFKSEKIFSFVDSLALLVRKDLRITQDETSRIKSVAEVTTNSPEAYRAYVEGLNLKDKIYGKEAASAFNKAIELDQNFAMAYYYLSSVQDEPVEKKKSIQKAVELADNTTERERLLIFAMNYRYQNKHKQAAEIYKQIIEKYPHEIEAYENLSTISELDIDLLRRGTHFNPSNKILWNDLAISYTLNDQKQEALDAVNEYIKLSPAEPNPYDTKGFIYAMFMEYDSSAVYYEKVLEFRKDFLHSAIMLGCYEVLKGKYKEAQKYFDMSGDSPLLYPSINIHRGLLNSEIKRLEEVLKTNLTTWEMGCTEAILLHLYYETGQFKKMLQHEEKVVSEWKKIQPTGAYGRDGLAWALVKNGKVREAERIIEDMLKNVDDSYPWVQIRALFASATLFYEEGEYKLAVEKFNKAFSKLYPNHEPNIFYAICLLKTGRIQEAVTQFNRIKNWPITETYQQLFVSGGNYYGYIYNVKAHYWLGVAYEKLGEKEKAVKEYKIFLDTWKDADFDSPELKKAHIRVAELAAK